MSKLIIGVAFLSVAMIATAAYNASEKPSSNKAEVSSKIDDIRLVNAKEKIRNYFQVPENISIDAFVNEAGLISLVIAGREHVIFDDKANMVSVGKTFLLKEGSAPIEVGVKFLTEADNNRKSIILNKFLAEQENAKKVSSIVGLDFVRGSKNAMYIFSSPTCPHCHELIKQITTKNPNIDVYHFPVGSSEQANTLIETIACSVNPKETFLGVMNGNIKASGCMINQQQSDKFAAIQVLANKLGVQSYPTVFISENGSITMEEGATPNVLNFIYKHSDK